MKQLKNSRQQKVQKLVPFDTHKPAFGYFVLSQSQKTMLNPIIQLLFLLRPTYEREQLFDLIRSDMNQEISATFCEVRSFGESNRPLFPLRLS